MGICDSTVKNPQIENNGISPINNMNNINNQRNNKMVIHKEIQPIIYYEIQPIEITEIQPVIENIIIPVKQTSNKFDYKEEEYQEELPITISEKVENEDGGVIGFEPQSSPPTITPKGTNKLESSATFDHYIMKENKILKKRIVVKTIKKQIKKIIRKKYVPM